MNKKDKDTMENVTAKIMEEIIKLAWDNFLGYKNEIFYINKKHNKMGGAISNEWQNYNKRSKRT
jgi:hypothetical protein